jgi:CHAT domain-containing protein
MGTHASRDGRDDLGSSEAQRLPFSGEEIRGIDRMIHGRSEILLQERDLKRYFLNGHANSATLLHVSTHAFADFDNPENSRLLFSASSQDGAADYVFLRELYDLNLSRVGLATLSACDTERGKIIRGEGVQAFSRALLSAGARSSLTSLWRVDDQTTAEFMRQFYYFALRGGTSKAEALRLTKLKFMHSGTMLNDPRVWAAFVLSGDGLTPLPLVLSWTTLGLAALTATAGIGLLVWAYRSRYKRRVHRQHNA